VSRDGAGGAEIERDARRAGACSGYSAAAAQMRPAGQSERAPADTSYCTGSRTTL